MNNRGLFYSMRNIKFDITKLLAMYMVILGHLWPMEFVPRVSLYVCHMPTFFFISGYFGYKSIKKYSTRMFLRKKVSDILIPYMSWSMVYIIALIVYQRNISLMFLFQKFISYL